MVLLDYEKETKEGTDWFISVRNTISLLQILFAITRTKKYIWMAPHNCLQGIIENQIDFVLINERYPKSLWQSSVFDYVMHTLLPNLSLPCVCLPWDVHNNIDLLPFVVQTLVITNLQCLKMIQEVGFGTTACI